MAWWGHGLGINSRGNDLIFEYYSGPSITKVNMMDVGHALVLWYLVSCYLHKDLKDAVS